MDKKINIIDLSEHQSLLWWMINEVKQYKIISADTIEWLSDVLSFIENIRDLDTVDVLDDFIELKEKIHSSENIQSEILSILTAAEDMVKWDVLKEMITNVSEKFMTEINKNLANNDNVFISIYQQIFTEIIGIIRRYTIEEVKELQDIKNENLFKYIRDITEKTILEINEDAFMYQTGISIDKETQIKSDLMKKYPNVGKSNLSVLKNLKKLDKIYIKHIKSKIISQIDEYLKINIYNYNCFWDLINDIVLFISLLFRNWFKDDYEDFVESYLNQLFNNISERKQSSNRNILNIINKQNEESESISLNTNSKKNCPNEINNFLCSVLGSLNTTEKEKREIRSYILRIYLNRKSIRIKDMIYNFPISKDIITNDFISQAADLGISFENWDIKKLDTIEEQPNKTQTNAIVEVDSLVLEIEDKARLDVETKILYYIDNPKSFDGTAFIKLMQLAWYQVNHRNYVAKCFNKLYKDTQIRQSLLEELKRNIFSQEKVTRKKQSYWKINIYQKKGHRILFLEDNKTIDGIYNHDDYENRISNFLWN